MLQSILKHFDNKSNNYNTGLFSDYNIDRKWQHYLQYDYYDIPTQFIDSTNCKISKTLSLFDIFHGWCMVYLSYFITMNPDWTPVMITGKNETLYHAFATKTIENITYFADARGITDNALTFFTEYQNIHDTIKIQKITDLPELTFEDMLIMKKAYDIIYNNKIAEIA